MPVAATTPGDAQSAQYVYVVGGWGDGSPDVNVDATQRYDMSTNTWETGPVFESARADLALSATRGAIYAAGGDADGGGPFDSTNVVERLGAGGWPGAGVDGDRFAAQGGDAPTTPAPAPRRSSVARCGRSAASISTS